MKVIFKMVDVVIVGDGIEDLCVKMEEIFSKINGGEYCVGLEGSDDNMDIEEFVSRIISGENYGWVDGLMERGDDLYVVEVLNESDYSYLK